MDLKKIKLEYNRAELKKEDLAGHPFEQIQKWFKQAEEAQIEYLNAASIATVSREGIPSNRIILIKEITKEGAILFTDYESHKGADLAANSYTALCIFWKELDRQIRIIGKAEKISEEASTKYFHSRPKESQVSAYLSHQSHPVTKEELEEKQAKLLKEYENKEVPRPKRWGGYLVKFETVEIWQGRPNRLHDRFEYQIDANNNWSITRLSP